MSRDESNASRQPTVCESWCSKLLLFKSDISRNRTMSDSVAALLRLSCLSQASSDTPLLSSLLPTACKTKGFLGFDSKQASKSQNLDRRAVSLFMPFLFCLSVPNFLEAHFAPLHPLIFETPHPVLRLGRADYFSARRELEDSYLKALSKLSKRPFLTDASVLGPGFSMVYERLISELGETASVHSELEKKIADECEMPFRVMANKGEWGRVKEVSYRKLRSELWSISCWLLDSLSFISCFHSMMTL